MAINGVNYSGYGYQPRFTGTDPYLQQMIGLSQVNPPINQPVIPATNPIQQDTVEISGKQQTEEKKKLTKGQKWAIGFGALAATVAGIAIAHKISQRDLKKLYETKLVQSVLPEKLKFTKATTKEEALKFTKEVLGIKNVDENITLEALNFANKGIVDVSNANKGKLYMPKAIHFKEMKDTTLASVCQDVKSERFMDLSINKKYFDNEFLDKKLSEMIIKQEDEILFALDLPTSTFTPRFDGEASKLIQKYCKDAKSLNIEEKRDLFHIMQNAEEQLGSIGRYPLVLLTKNKALFEKAGIDIPFEELAKKTTQEQFEFAQKSFDNLKQKCKYLTMNVEYTTPHKDLYHEMGHLQDFGKNLKNVALNSNKYGIVNRWYGTTYGNMQEIFDKHPETFKSCYPDLYEFLTKQDIQQTAGRVSWYAQTSIGEFVAETYAKMVNGEKISDEVMKLYEKYGGPKLG